MFLALREIRREGSRFGLLMAAVALLTSIDPSEKQHRSPTEPGAPAPTATAVNGTTPANHGWRAGERGGAALISTRLAGRVTLLGP